ncbi:MAG: hypothetical protein H7329_14110 [Opitutaceae bacterium]|nr:hypothetical protein [Cytophagales bacterium]
MSLFKLTVKRSGSTNSVHFEKGMSIEVISSSNPLTIAGKKEIHDAFMRKYGIDSKKAGLDSSSILEVEKIS